jgi:hypothetical protein
VDALYPAQQEDDESDDENSSKDAADVHENLRWYVWVPISAWANPLVGALPHAVPDLPVSSTCCMWVSVQTTAVRSDK